jgi:hypothetical protein
MNQKNAEQITEYGPRLATRFAQFLPQYGSDASAQSFIKEARVRFSSIVSLSLRS